MRCLTLLSSVSVRLHTRLLAVWSAFTWSPRVVSCVSNYCTSCVTRDTSAALLAACDFSCLQHCSTAVTRVMIASDCTCSSPYTPPHVCTCSLDELSIYIWCTLLRAFLSCAFFASWSSIYISFIISFFIFYFYFYIIYSNMWKGDVALLCYYCCYCTCTSDAHCYYNSAIACSNCCALAPSHLNFNYNYSTNDVS